MFPIAKYRVALVIIAAMPLPALAAGPEVTGIPVDFILFGLTLLGVAVFHHYTLPVAVTGALVIAAYKIAYTGFRTGDGAAGFAAHLAHEWVMLVNLLCLLMGFAILSRHFEKSASFEFRVGNDA